ncbi:MAG: dephospho-CoA kinase, partial [Clostridiales bacterium]
MIIGITGSSGAGKSTVCEIIEKTYNSKTITADKIARKLSEKGTEYLNEIIQRFGNNVLTENGDLNRRKLANIIYSSKQKRQELNQITFKYIKKEIEKEIKNSNNKII